LEKLQVLDWVLHLVVQLVWELVPNLVEALAVILDKDYSA
jgi:hypothetical protein